MTDRFRAFDLVADAHRIADLQSALVAGTMERIERRHPFYRRLMDEHGLSADSFRDVDALQSFPLTEKADFVSNPEAFRLEPDDEDPESDVLWDVAYTSGTSTGRPTPMYQTAHDFRALMVAQRRMAEIRGMGPSDRIVNLYPLTSLPHGAWLRCNQAAAAIGASVTAGLSGRPVGGFPIVRSTSEVLELTVAVDPTVLWGVPSYVRRILGAAVERRLRLPSLRMVAVSGEPCGVGMRRSLMALASAAGAEQGVVVSDSLGATELQCGLVECEAGAGFHNPAPELFHLAAVDDAGRHVEDGAEGLLTLTHLNRRGTVLVRFLLGDRVAISNEPCPRCGRGGGRVVRHLGRSGRFLKVRGNLVDIGELSTAVASVAEVVEHQILVRRPSEDPLGLDELVVRVVVDGRGEQVSEAVAAAVARAARMGAIVEVVDLDVIWSEGPDMKPPRLVDQRIDA